MSGSDDADAAEGNSSTDPVTIEDDGVVRWFFRSEDGTVVFVRDILTSVAIVAAIGLLLFAISGVWPPLVAVESGSMEPNMQRGDLIFVVDEDRFVGDDPAADTGVVTLEDGEANGYETFGQPGDVIIFEPNGNPAATPIIHRAHFWVEEDENWVETRADEEIVAGGSCDDVPTCPAPHDGFVTKGDNNDGYDQYGGAGNDVVKPEWITGKAQLRIPWLGHVRLFFDELFAGMLIPSAGSAAAGTGGTATGIAAGHTTAAGTALATAGIGLAAGIDRRRR
ncbi:S26 family signal peptidase [Natrarchaeobaculum aegyptiacum]|uniref:S26 family signal peptidase n=2 Tax=Natrarchaeobaculum aegyptiacum TaxID=745377 RepID=A0A2Z2HRC1_9EURY|nr:S26 family signal peptidase [Natrarchaeobaculum aegyptiacum]ARS89706.1 S26 family signal peptidase [Natrarchaeobaculum aegyptiacum]